VIAPAWRRPLGLAAVVLVAGTAGYFSTCVLYPTRLVPDHHEVPALRGLDPGEATARLGALAFRSRELAPTYDAEAPSGTVAWQSPAPGTLLPEGAVVRVALSRGAPPIVVPDLEGFDVTLAEEVLRAAGLGLAGLDTVSSRRVPGVVVGQSPSAGALATMGQRVTLSVSGVKQ